MEDDFSSLKRRIKAAKPIASQQDFLPQAEGIGQAMRFGVELLASLIAGSGLGYLLDRALGTQPWLLVIGFFMGAVGGFINLKRAADQVDAPSEAAIKQGQAILREDEAERD